MGCTSNPSSSTTSPSAQAIPEEKTNFPFQDNITNNEFKKFQDMEETQKIWMINQSI